MESFLLITESAQLLPVFKAQLLQTFPTACISELATGEGFMLEISSRSRLYFNGLELDLNTIGWPEEELTYIRQYFGLPPCVYVFSYRQLDLAKGVISTLANSDKFLVDNDFGTLLPGQQFVQKILSEPNWNWFTDLSDDQ